MKREMKRKGEEIDRSYIILFVIYSDITLGDIIESVYSIRTTRLDIMGFSILTVNHSQ